MAIEKTIIIECDECGEMYTPEIITMSASRARKDACENGWKCSDKTGIDHCPDCKEP